VRWSIGVASALLLSVLLWLLVESQPSGDPEVKPTRVASCKPGAPIEVATASGPFAAAQALEASDQLAEAEAAYRRILEQDPTAVGALVGLGRVLRAKSPLQSEAVLQKALSLDSDDAQIWLELAISQAHMLHYTDALQNAEVALDLDPLGPRAKEARDLLAFMNANPHRDH
jgi:tetratricopeptide (TPR) repeat protein